MNSNGKVFWHCREIGKLSDFIGDITEYEAADSTAISEVEQARYNPIITIKTLAQIMSYLTAITPGFTEQIETKDETHYAQTEENTIKNSLKHNGTQTQYKQQIHQQQSEQYYWGGEYFNAYGIGTAWQIQIDETKNTEKQKNTGTTITRQANTNHCPTIGSINQTWKKLCTEAICLNDKNDPTILPHQIQLPLAFGSFAFDSVRGGWLRIPAVAVIVSDNRVFLYRASKNRDKLQETLQVKTATANLNLVTKLNTAKHHVKSPTKNPEHSPKTKENPTVSHSLRIPTRTLTATEWQAAAQRAIQIIQDSDIEKIVLAREHIVSADKNADPISVLTELETQYQSCWRYWLGNLIGASPEMLAQIIEGQLLCRVLAGTCVKGKETALLRSRKEQQEHAYAVESAYQSLKPLLPNIEKPATPFLLRLPTLSHLATDLTSKNPKISSLEAIAALHPTAAVCGTPRVKVQHLIPELEKIDRGHYAGPIGWVDSRGQGEWAIALRCAQILDGHQYRLLAGAGIVADSIPEKEYKETNTKMYPLLNAIKQVKPKSQ